MAEQYARGLWGRFAPDEQPFASPNGMEDNLRWLDDHIGLYTLQPPVDPATPEPVSPNPGDGQIFTDGTYAVFNAGEWRSYPARKGLRANLIAGTESWVNKGSEWASFVSLDTGPALQQAQAYVAAAGVQAGIATTAAGNAQSASRAPATWTFLTGLVGTVNGEGAEVPETDTGTHQQATATGYDGAVVNNAGRYFWNQAWGRWSRNGDPVASSKIPRRFETRARVGAVLAGSELVPGLTSTFLDVAFTAQDIINLIGQGSSLEKVAHLPSAGAFIGRTWEVTGDTAANNGMWRWNGATVERIAPYGLQLAIAGNQLARANALSWAELSALLKTPIGRRAYVPKSRDSGMHLDPVTGQSVSNAGEFEKVSQGWTRIGEDEVDVLRTSKMDAQWIPRGALDEVSRGEPRYTGDAVTLRSATVRNPSATLAVTNAPISISVEFARGECLSAAHLQLLDPTGTALPFQWEGALRPYDSADMSTWPDGSLRAGYLWIMGSLAAAAAETYTIRCARVPLSTAGVKTVTYNQYSGGTVHELLSPTVQARFESGQAYCLRRFRDRTNADFDLFESVAGWAAKLRVDGVDYLSSSASQVTVNQYDLVGASAFGYGVVFQEWRTLLTVNAFPSITEEHRYRLFGDGNMQIDVVAANSADLPSRSWRHSSLLTARATGLTATWDIARVRKTFDYGTSRFQTFCFSRPYEHNFSRGADGLQPAEVWGLLDNVTTPNQYEIGINQQTVMYANGRYPLRFFLQRCTAEDADTRWAQTMTPVAAHSAIEKPVSDLADIARIARLLAPAAITALSAATFSGWWNGVIGMIRLLKDGQDGADAALADFQSWCTKIQGGAIDPALKTGYFARWAKNNAGLEYQGRNTQLLYWLFKFYSAKGDATKAALVASYLHAFADAVVDMEVASGGNGAINLRGTTDPSQDCWNARTMAANALAASLSVAPDNVTRKATLDRIVAAYAAGEFAIGKWGYAPWNNYQYANWYTGRAYHYYCYQTFELLAAKRRWPAIVLPANDVLSNIANAQRAGGLVDEWRYNGIQTRRGALSTNLYACASAALAPSPDLGLAHEALRHAQYDVGVNQAYMDGFWNQGWASPQSMLMDVRALAEVVLTFGL